MTDYSEIDAMSQLQAAMDQLKDHSAQARVLRWALDKYGGDVIQAQPETVAAHTPKPSGSKTRTKKSAPGQRRPRRASGVLGLSKDLNLRPTGKQSLKEFVAEKRPANNYERSVVALYYLLHILGRNPVGINDIYTCFKDQGWRVPADLANTLQSAASHKAWLDTANMEDLRLVPIGENLVEHDLPRAGDK